MKTFKQKLNIIDGNHGGVSDGNKFIGSTETIVENFWSQASERDNAPSNGAFLSEGWSGL